MSNMWLLHVNKEDDCLNMLFLYIQCIFLFVVCIKSLLEESKSHIKGFSLVFVFSPSAINNGEYTCGVMTLTRTTQRHNIGSGQSLQRLPLSAFRVAHHSFYTL